MPPRDDTFDTRFRHWLLAILRVGLGGLFIFAASMKLSNPQAAFDAVNAFKFEVAGRPLPEHLAHLAAFALPWAELIAGVCLIVGLWTRAAAATILVLLGLFTFLIVSALSRGLDVKCSCFGKVEFPCTGGIGTCHIVRNSVLILWTLIVLGFGAGAASIDRSAARRAAERD